MSDINTIVFTQGDANVVLDMTAEDGDGNKIDLTGATFQTFIKGNAGALVTIPNGQHTANPDQTAHKGEYTIMLSALNTDACGEGSQKDMITQITIGSVIVSYHGFGILQVLAPAPAN